MVKMFKSRKTYEELNEIKKGQTGLGRLFENEGVITIENDTIKQIREDRENPKIKLWCPEHFIVPAVFQKYGIKNANGRIYPEEILKREVARYIEEKVKHRCSVGALDHPNYSTLSGHDVAHIITELHWVGHTLVGETEIHTTPGFREQGIIGTSGDLVANMLISNIRIGVSSRGVGSVKQRPDGTVVVEDDFELLGWDVVLEPSTPGANIGRDEKEIQQWVENETKNNSLISEKINRINKILLF